MASVLKNFIGGEYVASSGTQTFDVINPANKTLLAKTPLSTAKDVDTAVKAAAKAFETWRKTPAVDRIQPLFKLKELMEANREELARAVTIEHGKTLVEARGSVRRGIQMVETACGMPALMMGEHFEDIAPGIDCQAVKRPMGVFACIAPFNFPAMVPFWFWPFAVASGNTYVLKPSERVPMTTMKILELMEKCGFPRGVFNVVHGGKEVVDALCTHPDVKGISFVGSTPVAKHVYTLGTSHGKRVQSLGGAKNFMVVLPDALMDRTASTALESVIGCAGERCLAGSVIVSVGDAVYKEMCDRIPKLAADISVGDGLDPNTAMGPLISQEAKDRVCGLIESAEKEGAKIVLDGRKGVENMPGYFLKPTVIKDAKPGMRITIEETFGPVVILAKVETFDEAIAWMNQSEYANTTTLFTSSGAAARKFSYEVAPSMIGINIGVPAPMSFFNFGGSKNSFFGDIKAHGRGAADFFTDTTTTVLRWMSEGNIWRS